MIDILFTGGGTAGHVIPNIALFPKLKAQGLRIAYIGQDKSIEQQLVGSEGVSFYSISAGKLRRYFDLQNLSDIFKILLGSAQSLYYLIKLKPKLVFSKGGFVSCPVVWAAWLCRIPVILHESDISPGLANKLALPFANKVCYSFPETAKYLPKAKAIFTGLAIRDSLHEGEPLIGKSLCRFDSDETINKPCLLVIGGSLGAKTLNRYLRELLPDLLPQYNICHLCGVGGLDSSLDHKEGYRQFEYIDQELPSILAMSDLIISRAGATSIFEFVALNKPSLLIPLPLSASRGDQIQNAQSFSQQGLSFSIMEDAFIEDPQELLKAINDSFTNAQILKDNMAHFSSTNASHKLVKLINEYL